MSKSTYFIQGCPTCGRRLHIRVEYLGRQVVCQHCSAKFRALDSSVAPIPPSESGLALLNRAEELLAIAEERSKLRSSTHAGSSRPDSVL